MTRDSQNLGGKSSNARPQIIPRKPEFPVCSICNRHVILEIAKVDEYGHAIHEKCYLLKLKLKQQTEIA